jgi:hypothetical protein
VLEVSLSSFLDRVYTWQGLQQRNVEEMRLQLHETEKETYTFQPTLVASCNFDITERKTVVEQHRLQAGEKNFPGGNSAHSISTCDAKVTASISPKARVSIFVLGMRVADKKQRAQSKGAISSPRKRSENDSGKKHANGIRISTATRESSPPRKSSLKPDAAKHGSARGSPMQRSVSFSDVLDCTFIGSEVSSETSFPSEMFDFPLRPFSMEMVGHSDDDELHGTGI